MKFSIKTVTAAALIASAAFVLPVFAQESAKTTASPTNKAARSEMRSEAKDKKAADRMDAMKKRGDAEIDERVTKLNDLLTRVQGLKNVNETGKSSITAIINAEVQELNTLKAQIDGDTSTTSLKADVESITKAYRIYALVMPQIGVVVSADRINTIANMLNILGNKLQTRIAAAGSAAPASLSESMTDLGNKILAATSQAQAAVNAVQNLTPDNGDKTKMALNTAALKDARAKLKTATDDLKAAKADADTVIKALKKLPKTATTASTTP